MILLKLLGLYSTDDPVKNCQVYKQVGCAHVDGMLCNLKTCDIEVVLRITPTSTEETTLKEALNES